jgi:carboxymethylenebutenolidase
VHRMIRNLTCAATLLAAVSPIHMAARAAAATPVATAPRAARTAHAAATAAAATTTAAATAAAASALPDTAIVHLGPADGGTRAFVAFPPGHAAGPAVIVVHEWWGLNAQIREIARRLAMQGYVAIVPDLYHGKVAFDPETAHELSRALDGGQVIADLDAARAWLRSQSRTAKSRVGVLGFCVGGGYSLELALHDSTLGAAVMFYGSPITDAAKLAALRVPLQGHFGADDQGITPERVAAFRAALKTAGKRAEVYLYNGAGHAFMHEGRDSYRPDAARQAWARVLAFFQKNLKG